MSKGYFVGDNWRTNQLSLVPGGSVVKVIYEDHFRLYDKIKKPMAYINTITRQDPNIIAVEVDNKVAWKKD